jgi:hypothetical protein
MTIALSIASLVSAVIYSFFYFKKDLDALERSYKKTLMFPKNLTDNLDPIKESLIQMKTLLMIFLKLLLIVSPFFLIVGYVILINMNIQTIFFNFYNNFVIVIVFLITSLIIKNAKK